jgi:aryl-phospho-beta-D-glucosidase BglC (GH1 family)
MKNLRTSNGAQRFGRETAYMNEVVLGLKNEPHFDGKRKQHDPRTVGLR